MNSKLIQNTLRASLLALALTSTQPGICLADWTVIDYNGGGPNGMAITDCNSNGSTDYICFYGTRTPVNAALNFHMAPNQVAFETYSVDKMNSKFADKALLADTLKQLQAELDANTNNLIDAVTQSQTQLKEQLLQELRQEIRKMIQEELKAVK